MYNCVTHVIEDNISLSADPTEPPLPKSDNEPKHFEARNIQSGDRPYNSMNPKCTRQESVLEAAKLRVITCDIVLQGNRPVSGLHRLWVQCHSLQVGVGQGWGDDRGEMCNLGWWWARVSGHVVRES